MPQSAEAAVTDNCTVGGEAAGLVLGTQRHHEVIVTYSRNQITVTLLLLPLSVLYE